LCWWANRGNFAPTFFGVNGSIRDECQFPETRDDLDARWKANRQPVEFCFNIRLHEGVTLVHGAISERWPGAPAYSGV
jgi:hypothetical protein